MRLRNDGRFPVWRWGLAAALVAVLAGPGAGPATAQDAGGADAERIAELERAIIAVEQRGDDREAPAFRTNFPLAKLQLEKARLLARRSWWYGGESVASVVRDGLAALERLEAGEAHYAQPGKLSELAYITENDGTVQPYYLHVPSDYDPGREWPLIVFLHGYVPTISVLDPWVLGDGECRLAEEHGALLLIPYGRRNTDFQGVGEVDVLASTAEVQALYNVDPLRVHISGVSMGGMGAWNMALRHPGRYAAATPIAGHTDMHVWWPRMLPGWPARRDDIPAFRRWLVEWDNPVDLVMNARNQNIFVQHGEMDNLIPAEQSRTIVAAAEGLGIPIRYHEFKGQGHYIYWDLPVYENAWSWTTQQALDESPSRITYKTYSLKYDTAFWLQIVDFVRWGVPATVDCEVVRAGRGLRITTENVRLLRIDVQKAPLQKIEDFTVQLNGQRSRGRATANWDLYVLCDDVERAERAWPPNKRKGLSGPVEEVFDTAFVVVPGTAGSPEDDRDNMEKAQRWADEWDKFADGLPPLKLDTEITEEDIQGSNLVLFGTPRTNAILARIADRLPIGIGEGEYTVAGRTYRGDDLGLVMCYPNPLAPHRYVAVYAGELYGEKCGINHKHDLIPDFIVFNTRNFNYDDTNEHEVAGFFDMHWELCPELTWVREGR